MIRITGGTNRSRLLKTPDSELTKPTMDKVRAAVFSAIGDDIKNATVLDLFAGSGIMGFEAVSRGFDTLVQAGSIVLGVSFATNIFKAISRLKKR